MNTNPHDPLDQLLNKVSAPKAPPWFQEKTLARLRREKAQGSRCIDLAFWLKPAPVGALAGVLLVVVMALQFHQKPVDPMADVSLESALDAFASYTDESSAWGADPFF